LGGVTGTGSAGIGVASSRETGRFGLAVHRGQAGAALSLPHALR